MKSPAPVMSLVNKHIDSSSRLLDVNPLYEIAATFGEVDSFDDIRKDLKRFSKSNPQLTPYIHLILDYSKNVPLFKNVSLFTSSILRSCCSRLFSWGVPTPAAITEISSLGNSLIEIGAGTGYWSRLLHETGNIQVTAYDNNSWPSMTPLWFDVKRGGARSTNVFNDDYDVLLLCWPPYDTPMAYSALKRFKGNTLVYCGEYEGGCTGNKSFFNERDTNWKYERSLPSLRWRHIRDSVHVYTRR